MNGAISVEVTLSEPSKNLIATDFAVTNASVSNFQGSGLNYTLTLTPTANGAFTAKINGGKFTDFAGNGNAASNTLSRSNGEPAGTIGVLGPTRMDYPGSMVAVRAVARYVSRILDEA